jgi:hypothetical protein
MAKRKLTPMDDAEIYSHVDHWLQDSISYSQSELSQQRADSLKYYFGEPFGNEVRGKSQVVTRDVQETIDWIMPSLMKVFHSGGQVVKYNPSTIEDVPAAEQETEYVNYLFNRKNEGFKIMYDWFQNALMFKNGVVKVYCEEDNQPKYDYYDGIDEDTLQEIASEPDVEILAQTDNGDGTYAIKLRKDCKKRNIKICAIPPEQFLIDRDAPDLESARFCAHREEKTMSWLREQGVGEDVLDTIQFDDWEFSDSSPERLVRDNFDGTGDMSRIAGPEDEASRKAWVSECYVTLDVDGDGIAELRRIVVVGTHILSNEVWDCKPFADLCAHRIAGKFYGMSIYDKIKDIQELRSALMRNIMDNIYLTNKGRYEVVEGMVNYEDLLSNAQSGIVRVKAANAITPLPTPQLTGDVYNMLDRLENDRSKRTGVSDRSRGLDEGTLHSNQAATSVNQMMTAAEQQIDLIARMFAETGVKRLFQLLHEHAIKYQDQQEVFELRGQFVSVNPSNWRERTDMSVTVGVGNMNKDQQLLHLTRMFELTQTVIGGGGMGVLVSETNIYNMLKEFTENAGYKDVSKFWMDPTSQEAMQAKQEKAQEAAKPKPDDIKANAQMATAQAGAMKNQSEAQMAQITAQVQMAEIELKKQEATIKLRQVALQEAELQLERDKFMWERARDEAEYVLEKDQARSVALGDGKTPETTKRNQRKASTTLK